MSEFVLDASVALSFALPDEKWPAFDDWLINLTKMGTAVVPHHWWAEVSNGLLMAVRRKRVPHDIIKQVLHQLTALGVETIADDPATRIEATLELAHTHALTVYDALYVQLALDTGYPLAAFDRKLTAVAIALNIPTLIAPRKDFS